MSKLRALFCAVVLTGQMGTAMAQQWIEHRPAGGGYRVEMPGRPQVSTRVIQHEAGPLTLTEADVELGDSFFTVSYVDMPVDKMKTFSADKLLDGARDGTVAGMTIDGNKAALRHEDRLTVSGYPARHLVIEIPSLRLVSVMRSSYATGKSASVFPVLGVPRPGRALRDSSTRSRCSPRRTPISGSRGNSGMRL